MRTSDIDSEIADAPPSADEPHASTGQRVAVGAIEQAALVCGVADRAIAEALQVTDNFPDFIPISSKELAVMEMFLGDMIDALVKPPR